MPTHRLAAVLFADIVGYTALMQTDEAAGIAKASRLREVVTALVPHHGGDLIEMRGDGALCVFPSSLEAVKCAQEIQQQVNADVPLRIGLHLGDIVQRDGHLFGNAVNVASRIESMGVAGAVLLSSSIRQQIKNKSEFELRSLGKFTLKNVAEPMTVYALQGEGLTVPAPRSLTRSKASARPRMQGILLVAVGLILAVGGWLAFDFLNEKAPATLPTNLQQERVAVLPFVNQTGLVELDMLGNLISDWLTKGLLEGEGTTVLNPENVLPLLQVSSYAELSQPEHLPTIREATGVAVVIFGDYYQLGDSLVIQARIVEIESQNLISAIRTRTTQENVLAGLDALTRKVLSFWAVKGQDQFAQNPPAYDAYQAYEQATAVYITDPAQAEQLLWQAYRRDSSFLAPLFELVNLYAKEGQDSAKHAMVDLIASHQSRFTRWESNRFRRLQATLAGKWLLAGRMAEQQFQQDPSDLGAFSFATTQYNRANAPQLALALHQQLDPRFRQPRQNQELDWNYASLAFSLYQLERFEEVDSAAQAYDFPLIPDALAVIHLKALAQLGRWKDLERKLQQYQELGVVNTSGQITPAGQLLPLICDELLLLGETDRLHALADELKTWTQGHTQSPDYHRSLGFAHYYHGEYLQAFQAWTQEVSFSPYLPGWLQITLEISKISRLAICQAHLGDSAAARSYLAQLEGLSSSHESWPETQQYYLAQVYAALGEKEKALQALGHAIAGGYPFFQPAVYRNDPFLLPLRGLPEFEAMVEPKGK